jgi:hypothetical protein
MTSLPFEDRRDEMLADGALYGAKPEASPGTTGDSSEADAVDRAVASIFLAGEPGAIDTRMPQALRARLNSAAERHIHDRDAGPSETLPSSMSLEKRRPSSNWNLRVSWMVAAAAIAIAAFAWVRTPVPSHEPDSSGLRDRPGTVVAACAPWDNPEIPGVTGEVAWNESAQRGFFRLRGLPRNDAKRQQYQVWIIDRRGLADASGQSARISGGVFDSASDDVTIPINPAIPVQSAAAFAITIEEPGGTWVSSMKRRVVIAQLPAPLEPSRKQ